MKSKVYYSNARYTKGIGGPTQKLQKLLKICSLADRISPGDIVAIKMHFGEPGNARYIRPIFPVIVVDFIKACGGRPFVTDTTVMYRTDRKDYFKYLDHARRNGFTSETMGCPVIISGGFHDNGIPYSVKDPLIISEVTVSQEIWQADFLFSLAHFTLHLEFPFAASLKNVGMGCVTQNTKLAMHSAKGLGKSHINVQAGNIDGAKVVLGHFSSKIFACNIALDVTPECDCFNVTDLPVVPDLGIFLSDDIIACDKAAFDAAISAPGYPGSLLEGSEGMLPGGNKVTPCHPKQTGWKEQEEFIKKAGIGSLDYDLVELK